MSRRQSAPAKPRRSPFGCIVRLVVIVGLLGLLLGVGGVAGLFWFYGRDLPDIREARDYDPPQTTRVYASSGEVIAAWVGPDAIYRTVIAFDEIPMVMRQAMLAAEDAEFYNHPGIDTIGLLRAVYTNIRRGQLSQGASTITQQVVKNLVLSPERSIRRKVQEALLAFRLEENLTKDEILAIYLNEIFFGVSAYGVEEASLFYFGHSARELRLEEAALLAGLAQSPNRYNPYRNPERALARRAYVLRQMYEKAFIEEGEYRAADEAPLTLVDPEMRNPHIGAYPYYTDAVRRELLTRFDAADIFGGGLHVYTALDIAAQTEAQRALRVGLRAYDERHGWLRPLRTLEGDGAVAQWRAENDTDVLETGLLPDREYRAVVLRSDDDATVLGIGPAEVHLDRRAEGRMRHDTTIAWDVVFAPGAVFTVFAPEAVAPALLTDAVPDNVRVVLGPTAEGAAVVIDPASRHVFALAGGYDFATSSFNRAVQARRQVGSTFKPFVYAAAIAARVATPATIYADQPVTFPMPGGRTWSPQNYDGQYEGPMSLRAALARSRNVIAVRVLDQVGVAPVANLARTVGLDGEIPDNLTLALGSLETTPIELANAFAVFPAQCNYREPILVTRVDNSVGDSLFVADDVVAPVLDSATCFIAHSMMRSVVEGGTASRARSLERELAGKTGTTNSARDAWFVGYSADLLAAVWVGRDDNQTLGRRESGSSTALPIWIDLMGALLPMRPALSFAEPACRGIVGANRQRNRSARAAQPARRPRRILLARHRAPRRCAFGDRSQCHRRTAEPRNTL